MRAISEDKELEVAFTSDRPLLTKDKARLANLPRVPKKEDIAIARGQGDAMAMRIAAHDQKLHQKFAPQDPDAKAVFDALEQVRVEALGIERLPGMKDNLSAMLEDKLFPCKLCERDRHCGRAVGRGHEPCAARKDFGHRCAPIWRTFG